MKTSFCVVLCLFAVVSFMYAQDNRGNSMPPREQPSGRPFLSPEEMMSRFDADSDGKLSEEEMQNFFRTMREEMGDQMMQGGPPPFGGGFPGRGRMMGRRDEDLVSKFDTDGDGKLNDEERKAAREYRRSQTSDRRPNFGLRRRTEPKRNTVMEKTFSYDTNADLYDETVLRTLYLEFPNSDWYEELGDFYGSNVEVPADLTVDGVKYTGVGVRFRGNTSYMMLGDSEKRSFNISIDYQNPDQRLYGYRTLNLLNANGDPSMLREVLFARICRDYIPVAKCNFVKLVVNGENWGIYVNCQQFNKDFLRDWFGTTDGVRWKIPGMPGNPGGGLVWNGENREDYERYYELKTENAPNAWDDLIELCRVLNKTPLEELPEKLDKIFDIDGALWQIALENVLGDSDSYVTRSSDYLLYQDPNGRFHMIPYDNNETFRYAEGGPGGRRFGGGFAEEPDPMMSPVAYEDLEQRPVISRLLSVPYLRARYLAHVKTIVDEWLDWEKLAPIIESYQALIAEEVKADDKKLYPYETFIKAATEDIAGDMGGPPMMGGRGNRGNRGFPGGPPGARVLPSIKRFVTERRAYLLKHPELDREYPAIDFVKISNMPAADKPVRVKAKVSGKVDSLILHYSTDRLLPFTSVLMFDDGAHDDGRAGDGIYVGEIPGMPMGTTVRYYVEASAVLSCGITAFSPPRAELHCYEYRISLPIAQEPKIVINELMAANATAVADPQGNYPDWVELHNCSDESVDVGGFYLSDDVGNPHKWRIPENTIIAPGGYLVIWVDGGSESGDGLHAEFKLDKDGESLLLSRDDEILDLVEFGYQREDITLGRVPDGSGDFISMNPTPGAPNQR